MSDPARPDALRAVVTGNVGKHDSRILDAVDRIRSAGIRVDAYAPVEPGTLAIPGRVTPADMAARLERLARADLLVVVTPDGTTDFAVCAEIGAAVVLRKPIFGFGPISNETWRCFVRRVEDVSGIVSAIAA